MINLLVFDCDGVILESVDAKTEAFAEVAGYYGAEARDRLTLYHRLHGGVSRQEKFTWLFQNVLGREITSEEMEDLCNRFVQSMLNNVLNAPFVPGVITILNTWKNIIPMYVCTGTPTEEVRYILKHREIASYFDGIYGTPPAKAERLAMILKEAHIDDPTEAVMIGDAGTDMQAAEIVGTRFYGRGKDFARSGYAWGNDLTDFNKWLDIQNRG